MHLLRSYGISQKENNKRKIFNFERRRSLYFILAAKTISLSIPRRDIWHIVENLSHITARKVSVWSDEEDNQSDDYEEVEEEEEEEEEVVSVIESSIISTEAILEESDSEIISRVEVHTYTTYTHTIT